MISDMNQLNGSKEENDLTVVAERHDLKGGDA
jgi:hypothetical protein